MAKRNLRRSPWWFACCLAGAALAARGAEALRLGVCDPLARQNACACVSGYAQRDYHALARHLERSLRRAVVASFSDPAAVALPGAAGGLPELVAGSRSQVETAFAAAGQRLRLLAWLTGPDGATTQQGLFAVRQADMARSLLDLKGRRILFGPPAAAETHAAALAALRLLGLPPPEPVATRDTPGAAVAALLRGEADAAVVSAYALPLLVGCDAVGSDELRVIGRTAPVPFIALFATERLPRAFLVPVVAALQAVHEDERLCRRLESRNGFEVLPGQASPEADWTDWRGSGRRDGLCDAVPTHLPPTARFAWRRPLCAQGVGGVAATARLVIVSDKSGSLMEDVWRCLDAGSGDERWTVSYPVAPAMDFTSSARATARIAGETVYLLSARGNLLCVDLANGRERWRVDLVTRFGGPLPTWGLCGTPLLEGDRIIVQTASGKAGLVALDRHTGKELWRSPGVGPGYGSLLAAEFGGRRQIVGHDAKALCGWDPATGRLLWRLLPATPGDYHVPTPLAVGDLLLAATENNGTRLYAFGPAASPWPEPAARQPDCAPDTVSPILVDGRIWAFSAGALRCLDPADGLRQVWEWDARDAGGHVSLIGGNGHVLVSTQAGEVWLCPARPQAATEPERLRVFAAEGAFSPEVWSHPALVGTRLYVRSRNEIVCLLLE